MALKVDYEKAIKQIHNLTRGIYFASKCDGSVPCAACLSTLILKISAKVLNLETFTDSIKHDETDLFDFEDVEDT